MPPVACLLGTVVMATGLFLLYGQWLRSEPLQPVLAVASVAVLAALLLVVVMVLQDCWQQQGEQHGGE